MTRVVSLYLPHFAIERVRRAERRRAPPRPDTQLDLAPLAEAAADERALQCDAPKNTGWRPGARWARAEDARPWSQTSRADVAERIADLPAHRRPPMREMGRRSEAADHPFRAMPPDEGGKIVALDRHVAATWPPLTLVAPPAAPARAGAQSRADHGRATPAVASTSASRARPLGESSPPVPSDSPPPTGRGVDRASEPKPSVPTIQRMPGLTRYDEGRPTDTSSPQSASSPSPFDRLDPAADDRAAATLKRWRAMPSIRYPGEGPRPDKLARRGSNDPGATVPEVAAFFDTGRSTASAVARTCPERASPAPQRAADAEAPLVTVEKIGNRIEIAAVSPAAAALGIAPGMALTQARAAVPTLDVHDADPEGDAAELKRLAVALARRWCPVVAIADAASLLLDITGTAHLHGGEAAMATRLLRLLARLGFTAHVAIADTAGAAWAVGRYIGLVPRNVVEEWAATRPRHAGLRQTSVTPSTLTVRPERSRGTCQENLPRRCSGRTDQFAGHAAIIPTGVQAEAVAPLPIAALRLDADALELLARLGVDTIGDLFAMPRAPLARRFGAGVTRRLDQATGAAPEPLDPVVPPQPIAVERRFAEPIATAEVIGHWLDGLAADLATALAKAGLGARAVMFVAQRVDSTAQTIRIGLAKASRDPVHLLRLLTRRIAEIDPGYGIDALALHLLRSEPLGPESLGAALAEPAVPDLSPLVDTLANRIGTARLWRQRPIESDVPERSVATRAPLDGDAVGGARHRRDDVRQLDARAPDHPWHPRWPRPVLLLRRPEPIDHVLAELPDHHPRRFTWRGVTHRVLRGDGPERITGEWWRHAEERDAVRDYYCVEDDAGRRFWLFRRGTGVRPETGQLAWYMHGAFS